MTSFELLKKEFNRIKNMGYCKGLTNDKNSSGITLEHLLKCTGADFNIPDFYDIEIKAVREMKNKHIDLFNSAPDGSIVNSTKWLSENFGYPDRDFPNIKVIKGNIYGNRISKIGTKHLFKLNIDYSKKRIYLTILNYELKVVSKDIFWDFDSLKEKLFRKDSKLAIFEFYKKEVNGDKYYRFTKLEMFKLKSFEKFIECIERGKIFLVLKTGVFKKGKYEGNFKNHGTSFRINKEDIEDLFDVVT